jgi:hypothetical protein
MQRHSITALLLLALVWLGACSSVTVQEKANVDYSQYRTYAWADTEVKTDNSQSLALRSQLQDGVLRPAIDAEMATRGFTLATTGKPDLYLTYHLYVEQAERAVSNPPNPAVPVSYPYLVRYGNAIIPVNYTYWYRAPSGYRTETYQEGTLVMDFIDARSNNMIWRGIVSDAVNNPARAGERFTESARDILDKFPVKERK